MTLAFMPVTPARGPAWRALFENAPVAPSDYSFVNIWGWAEEYGLALAWEPDLVWIRQDRPHPALWAPVGDWAAINDWPRRLETLRRTGAAPAELPFIRVPEALLIRWRDQFGDRLTAHEAREDWDYLYDREDLTTLSGNRFHRKKNLLNQFLKKNPHEYVDLTPERIDQALTLQEDWCQWRDCESSEMLAAENRVIARILNAWNDLAGLAGGAILVEGRMVAYTVGEIVRPETLLIHFEKGCSSFRGIYQAINQMFVAGRPESFRWVNREQDLGDEGLRKAKMSYNPSDFIKKYRVIIH